MAKAEATFGVDYSCGPSSSKSWGYSTTIPAGMTGLLAVLHRQHRVTTTKYTEQPSCTTASTNFYSYISAAATTSTDFCIIRHLYPYGYTTWRSSCVGE
jgi:hypothetical protein